MTPDPRFWAPTYAALAGVGLAAAIAVFLIHDPVVSGVAQITFGIAMALIGVHFVVYRRQHSEFLSGRMRLKYYTPLTITIIGTAAVVVGTLNALFAYLKIPR